MCLFELAPPVQFAVAVIGAATLLLAGFSALTQTRHQARPRVFHGEPDRLHVPGAGVGAWAAAIFHFMTHAFFKALLFLAAGIIIEALHHEHNIFRMGGLRKELPVAFWTFLIGGCSLAGLPLITAGYYSKDLILWSAGSSAAGGIGLWAAGIVGVRSDLPLHVPPYLRGLFRTGTNSREQAARPGDDASALRPGRPLDHRRLR